MQDGLRRTNKERSETMRAALVTTARELFVVQGFAATGTPEIAAKAGVTRGALYHHFADKTALFDAVIVAEARAVATAIRMVDTSTLTEKGALIHGGEAFLAAMKVPGRARLLLREAPAVLGLARLAEIDGATGGSTLVEGLAATLPQSAPVLQLAALLSAAFDRAALAIDLGDDAGPWRAALQQIISGIVQTAKENPA
jgi:AcrR family transcriptional regulator